jgi:hypothetical protein
MHIVLSSSQSRATGTNFVANISVSTVEMASSHLRMGLHSAEAKVEIEEIAG